VNFRELLVKFSKKTKFLSKFELMDQREFEIEKKKRIPASESMPICKLSMIPVAWNISFGQLGLAAC